MMTFYEWLVKNYRGEWGVLGDLAEYMALAEDAAHAPNTHAGMREYLESHGATKVELDRFEHAWWAYGWHTEIEKRVQERKDIDLKFPDTVTDLEIYLCDDRPQINVCMQDKQAPPWHGSKWIEQVLTLDEAKRLAQHLTEWVKKWEEQGDANANSA